MRNPPSRPALFAMLRRLARDCRGGTAIEYGLIVSLIVIAMMASFLDVASVTRGMWNNVNTKVTNSR